MITDNYGVRRGKKCQKLVVNDPSLGVCYGTGCEMKKTNRIIFDQKKTCYEFKVKTVNKKEHKTQV